MSATNLTVCNIDLELSRTHFQCSFVFFYCSAIFNTVQYSIVHTIKYGAVQLHIVVQHNTVLRVLQMSSLHQNVRGGLKQDRITAKDPRPPALTAFSVSIVSGRWHQVLVSGRWQIWRCGKGGRGETCHLKTHAPLGGGVGKKIDKMKNLAESALPLTPPPSPPLGH